MHCAAASGTGTAGLSGLSSRCGGAVLSTQRLPSVYARRCGSGGDIAFGVSLPSRLYCGACLWFTPAVCRIAPNRTACGSLRSYSAGSRSPFARSRDVGAVICLGWFTSGLAVYLWRSRRVTGGRGTGNGVGGAAFVCFCAATSALKCFPRGVRWGCAPQTAPKSLRLSGLSSRCGGAVLVRIRGLCASLRNRIGFEAFSAGSTLGAARPQTCAKESKVEAALRPLWTLFRGWSSGKVRFTRRLPLAHACCLSRDKQDGLR